MLFPIKQNEINKLIPVVATGKQFNSALGNPQKIFQRIMVSTIGGVITLLISQSQVTSQFYSLWLVSGVVFLLYIYTPLFFLFCVVRDHYTGPHNFV